MNEQKKYFDQEKYQFTDKNILHPTGAQQSEMQALQRVSSIKKGDTILDFGAGTGRVAFWFLRQGINVVAMDISDRSLKKLQEKYNQHKTTSWGKLGTTTKLNNQQKFDAVVGADILHHIDLEKQIPSLVSVVKPGGRLVFSEPNGFHLPWYIHLWRHKLPWSIEKNILKTNVPNLLYQWKKSSTVKSVEIFAHGIWPTPLTQANRHLHQLNLYLPRVLGVLRLFAFRLLLVVSV